MDITNSPPASFAQRHLEGANYLFTDGHVKWLKGDGNLSSSKINNYLLLGDGNTPTFAIS